MTRYYQITVCNCNCLEWTFCFIGLQYECSIAMVMLTLYPRIPCSTFPCTLFLVCTPQIQHCARDKTVGEIWFRLTPSITSWNRPMKYRPSSRTRSPILYVRPLACIFITWAEAQWLIHRAVRLIKHTDVISGPITESLHVSFPVSRSCLQ